MSSCKAVWQGFISAEACHISSHNDLEAILISFGGEEGPVMDLALSVYDASQLVTGVLKAISSHEPKSIRNFLKEIKEEIEKFLDEQDFEE